MSSKIFFISESLSSPFDEGIKNVAFSVHRQLKIKTRALSVTKTGNNTANLEISKIGLNKLFLNVKLRKLLKNFSPDLILYLPEASITFNSFVRAKVLKLMHRPSRVVVLGVQHREYSSIQNIIIANLLKPDLLLLLKNSDGVFFMKKGLKVKILPPAVDTLKFSPATKEEKEAIRAEYNIPNNKTVVSHVGHIKTDRNIECLLELQQIENIQVVIVGSSSTKAENNLMDRLVNEDIQVINKFIPDISQIYKMSDIYVFPVFNVTSSIDMPLSVLEAMACNLPVITTRFGGLVDYFKEDSGFKYFKTTEELVELIKGMNYKADINNSEKVRHFTWDKCTESIITAFDELILN